MVIGFCGYKVLHTLEKWAWIPVIGSFVLLTAFGGRHLGMAKEYEPGMTTPGNVLSFASIVVGFSSAFLIPFFCEGEREREREKEGKRKRRKVTDKPERH